MLMVCILHIGYQSGMRFLDYDTEYAGRVISNAWMALCIIAVNLYALLTGYLCINRRWNIQRYVELWITVCFYSITLFIPVILIGEQMLGIRSTLLHINPCTSGYWYFNAYTGLFVIIPFLNKGLNSLSQRDYRNLTILLLLIYSFLGCWKPDHIAQNGYNAIWLIILYVVGGYIKLHRPTIPAWILIGLAMSGMLVNFSLEFNNSTIARNLLWSYASIFTFMASFAVFLLSIKISIRSKRLTTFLKWAAPSAFGVYLIQCHPFIWQKLANILKPLAKQLEYSWWFIPVAGVLLYALGTLLDWIRIQLFILLKVKKVAHVLTNLLPRSIRELDS